MTPRGQIRKRRAGRAAVHGVGHDRRSLLRGVGIPEDVLDIVCGEGASCHIALLKSHGRWYWNRTIWTDDGRVHGDAVDLAVGSCAMLNEGLRLVHLMGAVPAWHVVSRGEMGIARLALRTVGHPRQWLLSRNPSSLVDEIHVILEEFMLLVQLGLCLRSKRWDGGSTKTTGLEGIVR